MRKIKRITAFALAMIMLSSLLPMSAFAKKTVRYLNFGDSIARGVIENEELFPEYDPDEGSYSALLTSKLGLTRTNYARCGMMTSDILYLIDDEFKAAADSGKVLADSWNSSGHLPFDDTSRSEVKADIRKADYITLCVGGCDFWMYPAAMSSERDSTVFPSEAYELLKSSLAEGKLSAGAYSALLALLNYGAVQSLGLTHFIVEIIDGYLDYLESYPQIVKNFRENNPDAVIILVGNYLPGGAASFLKEDAGSLSVQSILNRVLDNFNYIVKDTAEKYNCVYVDTMGIESVSHPTPSGHSEIARRILSVLEGDTFYAGNTKVVTEAAHTGAKLFFTYTNPFTKAKTYSAVAAVYGVTDFLRVLFRNYIFP